MELDLQRAEVVEFSSKINNYETNCNSSIQRKYKFRIEFPGKSFGQEFSLSGSG